MKQKLSGRELVTSPVKQSQLRRIHHSYTPFMFRAHIITHTRYPIFLHTHYSQANHEKNYLINVQSAIPHAFLASFNKINHPMQIFSSK